MTQARSKQMDYDKPGYYHVMGRCVRRAWLCGEDELTKINYDYRKIWVRDQTKHLSENFYVEIGAYAVMSNHLHLVVRNRPDLVEKATNLEVARRYLNVYPGKRLKKDIPRIPTEEEIKELSLNEKRMAFIRLKMSSISAYMQAFSMFISLKANKEDERKGHFWEYRFRSQLLSDEKALLLCSAYVDLNPVRANVCELPEESEFTSVHERITSRVSKEKVFELEQIKEEKIEIPESLKELLLLEKEKSKKSSWLGNFSPVKRRKNDDRQYFFHITETEYLELIDWTGRTIRKGKGSIPENVKGILDRLKFREEDWLNAITNYGNLFFLFAGSLKGLSDRVVASGKKWLKGMSNNKLIFGSS